MKRSYLSMLLLLLIFLPVFSLSTTGISKTDFLYKGEGNNPLPKSAWLVEFTVRSKTGTPLSSGERVAYSVKPVDDVDKLIANETVEIEAIPTSQYCEYSLSPVSGGLTAKSYLWGNMQVIGPAEFWTPFIHIDDWFVQQGICEKASWWKLVSGDKSWCSNIQHDAVACRSSWTVYGVRMKVVCVVMDRYSDKPSVEHDGRISKHFGVQFNVKKESDSAYSSKVLDVSDPSGWINDRVYAEVLGGLETQYKCPDISNYIFVYDGSKYVTTTKFLFEDYQRCLPEGFISEDTVTGWEGVQQALDIFSSTGDESKLLERVRYCNNLRNQVLHSDSSIFKNVEVYDTHLSSDKLDVIFKQYLVTNPVVRMFIDAEWVGVTYTVPEPKIESVGKPSEFNNQIEPSVSVQVKNTGKYAGDVVVSLSCSPAVYYPVGKSKIISLSPGESRTVSFGIKYSEKGERDISCLVTAYAKLSPALQDTKRFSIHYKYVGYNCVPGQEWCSTQDESKILYCDDNGEAKVKYDCSELGNFVCSYDSKGKPICVQSSRPPVHAPTNWVPLAVGSVVVVALIGTLLLVANKFGKVVDLKLLMSVAFATALGGATYFVSRSVTLSVLAVASTLITAIFVSFLKT